MNPPFQMRASRYASLVCDGKHVVSGRASFCWETFLMRRASGVPGDHKIRLSRKGSPWHSISLSIDEAEAALLEWSPTFGARRVNQSRTVRANRNRRGLVVK